MNKKKRFLSTKNVSRNDWLDMRRNSIGGSEAGSILGLSQHECAAELWGRKIGMHGDKEANASMFFGNYLEDKIAELWQFWDGSEETYYKNYNANNKIRTCKRVHQMRFHPDYDYITGNIDRIILDQHDGRGPGILECKNISSWNMNQYEDGIPPQYKAQVQHYLMVFGYKWGELAMMVDGRKLMVFEFERDDEFIENMLLAEKEFWELHVQPALLEIQNAKEHGINPYESEILWKYEPQADGSLAYENYLKTRYIGNGTTIFGNSELLQKLQAIKTLSDNVKDLEDQIRDLKNHIKEEMGEAEVVEFETGEKITWRGGVNGGRSFRIKV
jgi:putative phage-type endonuclease